jgi:hypothetical protein
LSEEELSELQAQMSEVGEEMSYSKNESYVTYKEAYLSSQYDQIVREYFLVPSTPMKVTKYVEIPFIIGETKEKCTVLIKSDMITDLIVPEEVKLKINEML